MPQQPPEKHVGRCFTWSGRFPRFLLRGPLVTSLPGVATQTFKRSRFSVAACASSRKDSNRTTAGQHSHHALVKEPPQPCSRGKSQPAGKPSDLLESGLTRPKRARREQSSSLARLGGLSTQRQVRSLQYFPIPESVPKSRQFLPIDGPRNHLRIILSILLVPLDCGQSVDPAGIAPKTSGPPGWHAALI
jgi:hypothetical protein